MSLLSEYTYCVLDKHLVITDFIEYTLDFKP